MASGGSLLEIVQSLIERTYRMETGIQDIERYIVGDRGLRSIYGVRSIVHRVESSRGGEAMVLVREQHGELFVTIYYPDQLIDRLERSNPLSGLDVRNLEAFAVFVEELDHFLVLAERVAERRTISLFALELHANVTKFLTCRHFLERSVGRPLTRGELGWLGWTLFEKVQPSSGSADVAGRYADADRLARRYCRALTRLAPVERLAEIRSFHRRSQPEAVRQMERLAEGCRAA